MAYQARHACFDATDLDRDAILKWSAEYPALRATQNIIGSALGLNAASRKQLAGSDKARDIIREFAAAANTGNGK